MKTGTFLADFFLSLTSTSPIPSLNLQFPNGKVESKHRTLGISMVPEPGPGSVVFVPEKDPNDKKDYTAMAGSVAQILASLVAIVVVVTRK